MTRDLQFHLQAALEGSDPAPIASFADYRAARAAAVRRLRKIDLARPGGAEAPQVNCVQVYFDDELVFEASKDGEQFSIDKEVMG